MIIVREYSLRSGKYNCAADLQFDWFAFNQATKSIVNFIESKATEPKAVRTMIHSALGKRPQYVFNTLPYIGDHLKSFPGCDHARLPQPKHRPNVRQLPRRRRTLGCHGIP